MKKTLLFLAFIILAALPLKAQVIGQPVTIVNTAPGTCTTNIDLAQEYQGVIYICVGGNYAAVSTTAAGGSVTGLHAGRVVVGASATTLTDYAGFTHDGTTLTVAGLKDTGLTSGRVPFATTGGLLTDSSNLVWDSANNRLGINQASPSYALDVTGAFRATSQSGTTASSGLWTGNNAAFDGSNYERMGMIFLTNIATLLTDAAGTGTQRTFQIKQGSAVSYNANAGYSGFGATAGSSQQVIITPSSTTTIGQIIKLAPSQSADAFQVQNSSGTVYVKFDSRGTATFNGINSYVATIGSISGSENYPGIWFGSAAPSLSNYAFLADVAAGSTLLNNTTFLGLRISNTTQIRIESGKAIIPSGLLLNFSSTSDANSGVQDLGLARNAAGVLEINNGTAGTYRDLYLRWLGVGTAPVADNGVKVLFSTSTTGSMVAGLNVNVTMAAAAVAPSASTIGAVIQAQQSGTAGSNSSIYGLSLGADSNNSTNTVPAVYGLSSLSRNNAAGQVNALYGALYDIRSSVSGAVTVAAYGAKYQATVVAGATITTLYNNYIAAPSNSGTLGTNYGLYLENQTGATTNYAIYSAGGASLLNAGTASVVPLTIKGAASQSGDLTQWQNSSGAKQLWVNADGISISWLGSGSIRGIGSNTLYINDSTNANGYAYFLTQANGIFQVRGDMVIAFSGSTSNAGTASDAAFSRLSAGVIGVGTGALSSIAGSMSMTNLTLAGNFFAGPSTIESFTTNASALGTLNYYTDSQTIYYDTAAATADVTINVDASASVDLNTRLATGQLVTVVLVITNTGTAYKCNTLQIHSVGQTIKWVGGAAPTGTINATDFYTFTIMKTGASTYYVTGSKTSYY